ncbi:MAG TPA: peptidyl-tRNA hydrolase [Herpetosiphon sp.]|uniref:Peptidyl-tRNA hydrolase n=1 Tax=Herpetosiphon aurantiacus (strain ATCC 23779 / DSM 785 / 114-95) TaxID=316274 RepID=PTH_HERA2|nr:aminoacyl-tRNA hydrolase [Herpetosiphon sp.]A9B7I9.1 RecName: Full=Peptidyl-tRNA hydrolase; Short=PTH [Herpetosiphon aurantiacus DSM 785]ABX02962.1 Aminoacyl-tRNA hydrolase [Herpetosiphon aurantiacus DSM 785]HBW50938.1 peptidyl-tRNA hydrolase [Herpetosiphon sp.]
MFLIVGLGNPGEKYLNNRHNVGFQCVAEFARRHHLSFDGKRSDARIAEGLVNGQRVALARPQTFMNDSGKSVVGLVNWYKIDPASELLVVYDDLDLPFGTIKLRNQGSSGGQRGMNSIIQLLGTQKFARLRFGIGRPPEGWEVINFVLGNWNAAERETLPKLYDRAVEACELCLSDGVTKAMNAVNGEAPKKSKDQAKEPANEQPR